MVTGGMGGLGEAICIKLAALGDVVISTYSPSNAKSKEWLASMEEQGFHFYAYPCDVTDWSSCHSCVQQIREEIGPVDVLVNNAGITRDMTFKKMDCVNWDAVMNSNLRSVFNMTKQVCDQMMERGWGRIINISSVNGQKGAFGQTNYSAAKAGIVGMTLTLAKEWGRMKVNVNCVAFGFIRTRLTEATAAEQASINVEGREIKVGVNPELVKMLERTIPLGRAGTTEEAAGAVYLLCTPESDYISGQTIVCGGGVSI